jgi:2-polyprenyl-3-methyl-5-hydroxy-6-metoxy-1,4-benzoquinol methylase
VQPISFAEFDRVYQHAVKEVFTHWRPQMQEEIARHCRAWAVGRFNFEAYLNQSSIRYYHAYSSLAGAMDGGRICDLGGFWGAFPLTLHRLGCKVSMTETLRYYGSAFADLFAFLERSGVSVIDFDPFDADSSLVDRFDAVTVMAILEHYPHSLKVFMGHVTELVGKQGLVYLEVPNMAYWPRRLGLLRGFSPLPAIEDVFHSSVPFTGHHREFTIHDLRKLAELAGLRIVHERAYNYSPTATFLSRLRHTPIATLVNLLLPHTRECLAVLCRASPG